MKTDKKYSCPLVTQFDENLWKGGEKLTWMGSGAQVGAFVGLILGALLFVSSYRYAQVSGISLSDQYGTQTSSADFFWILIPAFSAIVGAISGTFIGIGIPRFNPSPQQGHWELDSEVEVRK